MGLDSKRGGALSLIVFDEGTVGVLVGEVGDGIFLGSGPAGSMPGWDEPFHGLEVRRDGEVVYELSLAEGN